MAMQLETNGKCDVHNEDFMFYCTNCNQLICVSCVENHNALGHTLRKSDKSFPLIDEKCRKSADKLKQRKETLEQQLEERKGAKKVADTNGVRAVKELMDVFARVDALVETAKKEAFTKAAQCADLQQDHNIAIGQSQRAVQLLEHKDGALIKNKKQLPPRDHVRPFLHSLVDSLLQERREQAAQQSTNTAIRTPGYSSNCGLHDICPHYVEKELTISRIFEKRINCPGKLNSNHLKLNDFTHL